MFQTNTSLKIPVRRNILRYYIIATSLLSPLSPDYHKISIDLVLDLLCIKSPHAFLIPSAANLILIAIDKLTSYVSRK